MTFSKTENIQTKRSAMGIGYASCANVAVGFDALGFTIPMLFDLVSIEDTGIPGIEVVFEVLKERLKQGAFEKTGTSESHLPTIDVSKIPTDPAKNTAAIAFASICRRIGVPCNHRLVIRKGIPLSSGLGGSAASAVAAVKAAQKLFPELTDDLALEAALDGEAYASGSRHADNIAPSFFKGLVLLESNEPLRLKTIPVPRGLWVSIIHPNFELETKKARSILSPNVKLQDHVAQAGLFANFIEACYSNDIDKLGRTTKDLIIEPQRQSLIPAFAEAKHAAFASEAIAFSISGAGPSVFAFSKMESIAKNISESVSNVFLKTGRLNCESYSFRLGN